VGSNPRKNWGSGKTIANKDKSGLSVHKKKRNPKKKKKTDPSGTTNRGGVGGGEKIPGQKPSAPSFQGTLRIIHAATKEKKEKGKKEGSKLIKRASQGPATEKKWNQKNNCTELRERNWEPHKPYKQGKNAQKQGGKQVVPKGGNKKYSRKGKGGAEEPLGGEILSPSLKTKKKGNRPNQA